MVIGLRYGLEIDPPDTNTGRMVSIDLVPVTVACLIGDPTNLRCNSLHLVAWSAGWIGPPDFDHTDLSAIREQA